MGKSHIAVSSKGLKRLKDLKVFEKSRKWGGL